LIIGGGGGGGARASNSEGSLTHSILTVPMKMMNESFMKLLEITIMLSENVQFVKEDIQTQKSKRELHNSLMFLVCTAKTFNF
jgi:hypothetical protein